MDYLELFLSDMKQYIFGFEMFNLSKRECTFNKAIESTNNNNNIAILDRSYISSKVFATMMYEDDIINDVEMEVYTNYINKLTTQKPEYTIFLDEESCVAEGRCKKRQSGTKSNIYTIEYFNTVNKLFRKFIEEESLIANVLSFDWSEDYDESKFMSLAYWVLNELKDNSSLEFF